MMVINSGDPLPELAIDGHRPVGVALPQRTRAPGRRAARGRTGLVRAPALAAWWPVILGRLRGRRVALAAFGAKLGIHARLERLYVAVTVLACGTWVALAAALGPLAPPLPQALGIGAVSWQCRGGRTGAGACQGPRANGHSRHGRTSPERRARRARGHERHGGPVGMAGPAPPRPWTDHHRCDGEDTRARIGSWHPPRRSTRLPDTRMTWPTAVETAGSDPRPARGYAIPWPGPSGCLHYRAG